MHEAAETDHRRAASQVHVPVRVPAAQRNKLDGVRGRAPVIGHAVHERADGLHGGARGRDIRGRRRDRHVHRAGHGGSERVLQVLGQRSHVRVVEHQRAGQAQARSLGQRVLKLDRAEGIQARVHERGVHVDARAHHLLHEAGHHLRDVMQRQPRAGSRRGADSDRPAGRRLGRHGARRGHDKVIQLLQRQRRVRREHPPVERAQHRHRRHHRSQARRRSARHSVLEQLQPESGLQQVETQTLQATARGLVAGRHAAARPRAPLHAQHREAGRDRVRREAVHVRVRGRVVGLPGRAQRRGDGREEHRGVQGRTQARATAQVHERPRLGREHAAHGAGALIADHRVAQHAAAVNQTADRAPARARGHAVVRVRRVRNVALHRGHRARRKHQRGRHLVARGPPAGAPGQREVARALGLHPHGNQAADGAEAAADERRRTRRRRRGRRHRGKNRRQPTQVRRERHAAERAARRVPDALARGGHRRRAEADGVGAHVVETPPGHLGRERAHQAVDGAVRVPRGHPRRGLNQIVRGQRPEAEHAEAAAIQMQRRLRNLHRRHRQLAGVRSAANLLLPRLPGRRSEAHAQAARVRQRGRRRARRGGDRAPVEGVLQLRGARNQARRRHGGRADSQRAGVAHQKAVHAQQGLVLLARDRVRQEHRVARKPATGRRAAHKAAPLRRAGLVHILQRLAPVVLNGAGTMRPWSGSNRKDIV